MLILLTLPPLPQIIFTQTPDNIHTDHRIYVDVLLLQTMHTIHYLVLSNALPNCLVYSKRPWFTMIHPLQLRCLSHNIICSYQNKYMIFSLPKSLSSPSLKSRIPGFRKIWQHITGKDYRQMVTFLTNACMDLELSSQHQHVLFWDPILASMGLQSSSWFWVPQLFSGYQGSAIKFRVGMDMTEVYKYISESIH